MKVVDRELEVFGAESYVMYTFSSGHQLRQWYNGTTIAYTMKGNYATQAMMHRLARIASEYEDTRIQTNEK
ncbi:hypothetical protein UFOVP139_15 [uncultured Caudovirales phage]|uniref:Uncharacterized protein n=1 Tax=uncultured Caudovirales phage TaxID=2100421 RepID=A0A6J5LH35_9CAUD|nr:hypothetical protein UFOVP139_15 [uncultured Caudovirales phage]